jgi:hypothetical protein
MVDAFAPAQARKDRRFFVDVVRRHQHRHRTADGLLGGVAEDALRTLVPGLDDAFQRLGDDGVV